MPCEQGENCNQSDPSDWSGIHNNNHFRPEYAAVTPDGKVLLLWRCYTGKRQYIWNPADGSFTQHASDDDNVEVAGCIGLSAMPDGRIMVAGGTCVGEACGNEVDWVATFDFPIGSQPWTQLPPLPDDSWYPTITTLPDGRMLATGGRTGCFPAGAMDPSSFDPDDSQAGWSTWGGLPLSWDTSDPESGLYTTTQVNYPRVFVIPDDSRPFMYPTRGAPGTVMSYLIDLEEEEWIEVDETYRARRDSAVMYRPGKVMRSAGAAGTSPSNFEAFEDVAIIDLTGPNPEQAEWVVSPALPEVIHRRWSHDMIVLPDGKVLVAGGRNEEGPVFHAEWIDMDAQPLQWQQLADSEYPRIYHSVAVLLPDATVLAAGGNDLVGTQWEGMNESGDVFEPPYLFDSSGDPAPRPVIDWAPELMPYDADFCLNIGDGELDAGDIDQVNLIRTGAVTHGFDQNQRFVPLDFLIDIESNRLRVTSPPNATVAPPGY